ncbi:hypothetical protein EDB89DRAFT_1978975, partial [Lactarius sanguifluus]
TSPCTDVAITASLSFFPFSFFLFSLHLEPSQDRDFGHPPHGIRHRHQNRRPRRLTTLKSGAVIATPISRDSNTAPHHHPDPPRIGPANTTRTASLSFFLFSFFCSLFTSNRRRIVTLVIRRTGPDTDTNTDTNTDIHAGLSMFKPGAPCQHDAQVIGTANPPRPTPPQHEATLRLQRCDRHSDPLRLNCAASPRTRPARPHNVTTSTLQNTVPPPTTAMTAVGTVAS